MVTKSEATTPRRSSRFQPFVQVQRSEGISPHVRCQWTSAEPVHVRPTVLEDLFGDEREKWDEEDEEGGMKKMTSLFFKGFRRERWKGKVTNNAGARVSEEVYVIGDTVLIHTGAKLDSVGVIVALWETRFRHSPEGDSDDEDGDENEEADTRMKAKVHWFLRPSQLATVRAKRDHAENEIYYSLSSTATLQLSRIVDHCSVSAQPTKVASDDRGRKGVKKREDDSNPPAFYCRLAIDPQRGLFYKLDWEQHQAAVLEIGQSESDWGVGTEWDVAIAKGDRKPRKKGQEKTRTRSKKERQLDKEDESSESGDSKDAYEESGTEGDHDTEDERGDESEDGESPEASEQEQDDQLRTPHKKRKRGHTPSSPRKRNATNSTTPRTPRKPRPKPTAHPTPHSKAASKRRSSGKMKKLTLIVRPPPPVPLSPRKKSRISKLPQDPWLRAMHSLHVGARPDEVQLPCREEEYARILRSVEELLLEGSGGCVYISGVPGTGKTATVYAIVRELKRMAEENETNPFTYVEINGLKIPEPSAAYALLWEAVSGHDSAAEGRLQMTSKEALKKLTKHFSGIGRGPEGHACVVLMDELDQLVTAKQDVVYNFFNWPTIPGSRLVVIAVANTMDLPERVMTGRVRSRLGMIRINFQPYTTPQLEKIVHSRLAIAQEGLQSPSQEVISADGVKFAAMKVSSISGDARRVLDICRRTVELVQPQRRTARTDDVKEVIKVMQHSPTAAYLRECSFHERMMLAAVIKCVKREGVEEIKWGDVQQQHRIYIPVLSDSNLGFKPTAGELTAVLDSLLASRAMLIEDGATAARKDENERRVILNLEQAEVERVLGEVGGLRWKNALGM